jgi:hypothetical protein
LPETKTTSNGRRPQNIKDGISHQPLFRSSSNFKLKLMGQNQNRKLPEMKMTSNGRRHQNINDGIFQQPFIGFSSNFKLKQQKLEIARNDDLKWKMNSKY